MEAIFTEHPIWASIIALVVFVAVGAVDLIVLKNKSLAFIFWTFGFFAVLAPLLNLPSIGGAEVVFIICFAIAYILAVYKTYGALKDTR